MKLFVTGACGYKGTVLVPKLLAKGHEVVAFDIQWFGNNLRPHPAPDRWSRVTCVIPTRCDLSGVDAIIHLSSIANDPCRRPRSQVDVGGQLPRHHAPCRQGAARGHQALHLRLVRQRLRRQGRGAGHRGPRAGPDHRVQQDQDVRRAHPAVATATTWPCRSCGPATVCGFSPTHAQRRLGQPADHAGAQEREDHGVRRRPVPAERPHGRHHRPLPVPARAPRAHRRLQCRIREHFDPRYRRVSPSTSTARHRGQGVERSTLVPGELRPAARHRLQAQEGRRRRDQGARRALPPGRLDRRPELLPHEVDAEGSAH